MRPELITQSQWIKYNLYFAIEHFIGLKNSEKYLRPLKTKLYNEIKNNPGMENRGKTIDVKEIEYRSFEPFANNKEALLDQPLVFRGVAKDWPSVQKWSKDFFRAHYSQTPVAIIDNPGLVDPTKENNYTQTNFGKYFEEVEKDKDKYLRFSRVLDHNPVLLQDLDLNWLRQFKFGHTNMGEQTFLFMGEGGTRTPMHCGFTHTAFVHVKGRKKWTLCLPNERIFLDAVADRVLYYYTHANPTTDEPDPKFPLLPYVRKYEVICEEGDVLWFPSLNWHYIDNLDPTIGVAFKFTNIPQSFQITKMLATFFFLATKPTILRSFIYNRKNKQDYVFNSKSAKFH